VSGQHLLSLISPAMVDRARQRLAGSPNASVVVSDGQSLSFDQGTFDAVLCSLGLMFFPDPARGLSEFQRVLRPGGRAAVSVSTTPERSYNGRINVIIARYVPSLAEATARTFSLGDGVRLRSLFEGAGPRGREHCRGPPLRTPIFRGLLRTLRAGRSLQRAGLRGAARGRAPGRARRGPAQFARQGRTNRGRG
jgi:SAM-dependent methyltransferase